MSSDKQNQQAQGNDPFFRPIGQVVEDDAHAQSQLATSSAAPAGTTGSKEQAQAPEPQMVEEMESLCMRCHENGTTRLLLTYIPYFKEIIIASFQCDHCGERNNEVQSAGEIQGEESRATHSLFIMLSF